MWYLLSDCISAKATPQILSLNPESTVLFLKFLIIGLRKSLANCKFGLILVLAILLPDTDLSGSEADFLPKMYKP